MPEREDTLELLDTLQDPYELWATDEPMHATNNKQPLYGSVPYVLAISPQFSAAIAWVNSANTFIGLSDHLQGKLVNFVSESGSLELFAFCSTLPNRFKKVQHDLAVVSGFAPLPPIHSLGFHFSKWDYVSSQIMIDRNQHFTNNDFPVDVLWMDINYSD